MSVYKIYKLVHPVTCETFYIGRTEDDLNLRLKRHLWSCKMKRTEIERYIFSLLENDIRPKIELIEITRNKKREAKIINQYLPTGLLKNTWHSNWEFKGRKAA